MDSPSARTPITADAPASTAERLHYIDGLRGAASLAVACYHITRYGAVAESARGAIPGFLQGVFDRGWVGVQIFFVISGFVIAYSVRNARVTPGYLANYALRRSLRLDPPYWTTIALVLLLHALIHGSWGWVSPLDVPTPLEPSLSWWLVFSHVLYLHKLLGFDSLSAGFWTLCIEVQFYLLYVITLGLAQWGARRWPHPTENSRWSGPGAWLTMILGTLAIGSLFWFNRERPLEDWLAFHFYLFFPGCAACWVLTRQVPSLVFWGYLALAVVRLATQGAFLEFDRMFELKAALLTSLSIYVLGQRGRLASTLNWNWLQFLGKISYSLYLIHFPVSHVICTAVEEWCGGAPGPLVSTAVLLISLLVSVAAAYGLHLLVEAPSIRLANRFRPRLATVDANA